MLVNIRYLHNHFLIHTIYKLYIPLDKGFFFFITFFLFLFKKHKPRKLQFLCKHWMEAKLFFLYTCLYFNRFISSYLDYKGFSFYFHKKFKVFTIVKSPCVFKKVKEHLGIDKYKGILSFW